MKLTKINSRFEIYISDQKNAEFNAPTIRINNLKFYRFMDRLYIPDRVYKLSTSYVKEVNNIREEYALKIIDKEYNDRIISQSLNYLSTQDHSKKMTVLDFGCGYGYAGHQIKSEFDDSMLFGYDIRKPKERKLLKIYSDVAFSDINSKMPYSNDMFDIILAYFVFQFFIPDFQLAEINRILKPNGVLFINLINSADDLIREHISTHGFEHYNTQKYTTKKIKGTDIFIER